MPIQILTKTFNDLFGNSTSFYRSNVGDKTIIEFEINEEISVQSGGTNGIIGIDPIQNIVLWNTGNFLNEGFRIGDTINFSIYASNGSVITSWSTLCTNVTATELDVNSIPQWYDYTAGQIVRMSVETRKRESLTIYFNHFNNGQQGNEFSLIDGEATIFNFDLNGYVTGATYIGTPVGANKSGQFEITASILDNSNYLSSNDKREYLLTIEIINSGLYDQTDFNFSNCLKFYAKFKWSSLTGEPFNQYINVFNDDADTGFFNEAFNTDTPNATLVQGIQSLDYINGSTGQFIIDSSSSDYGFGSAYLSNDSAYYKNRPFNQSEITMVIPTKQFSIGVPETSATNEFGANYQFTIDNVSVLGTIYTIDFTFIPNAQFGDFMDNREEGDKLFNVWARFGNINLLVFSDQIETELPIGGLFEPVGSQILDHSQNYTFPTSNVSGYSANIEDDLAFAGLFRLENGVQYESLLVKIEAFNSSTNDSFALQSTFFDFSSVPFVGGKHILNLNQPVLSQLPTTSEKRNALCELFPAIDTPSEYGIKVYFPFLYRWEYWLAQLNASADFYPNEQTKNWFPYDTTGDWSVRLRIETIKDGLVYSFDDDLTIKNYDSELIIQQNIDLFIESTNQLVGVVVENELMRVRIDNTLINGSAWDTLNIWGMITIEPTESSPRWLVSSVVPFDYNLNNPLKPIVGDLVQITFPTPNVARLECFFDPSKINLQNGCKFTGKIKGCLADVPLTNEKITTDGVQKLTTDGQIKLTA